LLTILNACQDQGAQMGDPVTRLIDQDFTNTDTQRGYFWRLWEQDLVDPLVDMSAARALLVEGPAESRAWGRGQLIRHFADDITDIDWGYIELRRSSGRWRPRLRIGMPRLESLNRNELEPIVAVARTVEQLEALLADHPSSAVSQRDPVMEINTQLIVAGESTGYQEHSNGRDARNRRHDR
jgi:hypothetical protein